MSLLSSPYSAQNYAGNGTMTSRHTMVNVNLIFKTNTMKREKGIETDFLCEIIFKTFEK